MFGRVFKTHIWPQGRDHYMVLTVFGAFGDAETDVIIQIVWAWYQNLVETLIFILEPNLSSWDR